MSPLKIAAGFPQSQDFSEKHRQEGHEEVTKLMKKTLLLRPVHQEEVALESDLS